MVSTNGSEGLWYDPFSDYGTLLYGVLFFIVLQICSYMSQSLVLAVL